MLQPTLSRCARPALLAVALSLLLLSAGGRPHAAREPHGTDAAVGAVPTVVLHLGTPATLRPIERSTGVRGAAAMALLGALGLALLATAARSPRRGLSPVAAAPRSGPPAVDRHWLDGQRPALRRGPPPRTP